MCIYFDNFSFPHNSPTFSIGSFPNQDFSWKKCYRKRNKFFQWFTFLRLFMMMRCDVRLLQQFSSLQLKCMLITSLVRNKQGKWGICLPCRCQREWQNGVRGGFIYLCTVQLYSVAPSRAQHSVYVYGSSNNKKKVVHQYLMSLLLWQSVFFTFVTDLSFSIAHPILFQSSNHPTRQPANQLYQTPTLIPCRSI